jgi:hypothetical protein
VELFGIVLAVPAAFVASAVYSLALRFVLRRWRLAGVALWCSVGVLTGLVLEWVALAIYGPVRLQEATRGAFFPFHSVVFFLSIPALASVLVVKRGDTWLGSWIVVGVICAGLALPVVLTQYVVSEALYGIG